VSIEEVLIQVFCFLQDFVKFSTTLESQWLAAQLFSSSFFTFIAQRGLSCGDMPLRN